MSDTASAGCLREASLVVTPAHTNNAHTSDACTFTHVNLQPQHAEGSDTYNNHRDMSV